MTAEEKEIFQAKVKKAVMQVDINDFSPYIVVDGKRFNVELYGDDEEEK